MNVSIVGAGALGRVYGVRLASAGVEVSFVVRGRAGSEGPPAPLRIERVDGDRAVQGMERVSWGKTIRPEADLVLVTVRAEQLEAPLLAALAEGGRPIVVLTPMLPHTYARVRARLGAHALAAMPSVVAYVREDGVTRHWLPPLAKTLIEEPRSAEPAVDELVASLARAGIGARVERGVHETNPATTVKFLPLMLSLDAAGGFEGLLEDVALYELTKRACHESADLARRLGSIAAWANVPFTFVGRRAAKVGLAMVRARRPEAVRFVEEHFGRKVHAQNAAMAEEMLALAVEKGLPHDAMAALARAVRERP